MTMPSIVAVKATTCDYRPQVLWAGYVQQGMLISGISADKMRNSKPQQTLHRPKHQAKAEEDFGAMRGDMLCVYHTLI